ncbi:MAG TPA: glutathione S-transferase N-terminal domain-containing protein [Vulgatibacter sp.]|nr:glutathione S-transferase N-terminal domain-containing protein [Vulgatibacter sp.]
MVKLFGLPGACPLAPHIVFEEAGIPYEYRPVQKGEPSFEEVKRLNPMAQVPVLVFDDGRVLTQNSAILHWVAAQVPEKKLLPQEGTFERARADEWIAFLGTTVHPAYGRIFNPAGAVSDPARHDDARRVAIARVEKCLGIAEERLGEGPWALGESYSVVDPYLYVFVSWAEPVAKLDLARFPNLRRHAEALKARPAAQRAFAAEGLGKK